MPNFDKARIDSTIYIYVLRHPESLEIVYTGATSQPRKRFTNLGNAQGEGMVGPWLRQLRSYGLRPVAEIVQESDELNWAEDESRWIALLQACGESSLNIALGGRKGVPLVKAHSQRIGKSRFGKGGHRWTKEEKIRISQQQRGKPDSEETRRKRSESMKRTIARKRGLQCIA